MTKLLLNNKKEFIEWKGNNYPYFSLIHYDDEEPTHYPCVVVEHVVDDYYSDKDYLHYIFVYI